MNQILLHLSSATKNLHVSIPLALALGCEAGKIWLPKYRDQFDATQKMLYSYGILAAYNSSPKVPTPQNDLPPKP